MSEKQEMSLGQWIGENSRVLLKLGFFTVALFSLPVITYFYTVDNVFKGNTSYAAGSAAVTANVIMILYVITALFEAPQDNNDKKKSD